MSMPVIRREVAMMLAQVNGQITEAGSEVRQ